MEETVSANGRLTRKELSEAFNGNGPRVFLSKAAAAAWNTLCLLAAERKDWGTPGFNGADSAYRTYDRQVYWRNYWCNQGNCGNAAMPGTSNHGLGNAADVNAATQAIFRAAGAQFGWKKVEAMGEPWHWNYTGGFGRPDPGPDRRNPRLANGSGGPGQDVWVRKAQQALTFHGYEVKVDGSFGKAVKAAVKHFQDDHHLNADGVIGPNTWDELRKDPDVSKQGRDS